MAGSLAAERTIFFDVHLFRRVSFVLLTHIILLTASAANQTDELSDSFFSHRLFFIFVFNLPPMRGLKFYFSQTLEPFGFKVGQ